jgi:predicted negative regulator of RcsB-dependent stress response
MIEQKRIETEEKIVDDPNGNVQILRLEHRAEMEKRRGQYDKAIATLSELMTLRIARTDNLKLLNGDASVEIAATVKLLHTFGDVFALIGDTERSQRAYKDANRLHKKNFPSKTLTENSKK